MKIAGPRLAPKGKIIFLLRSGGSGSGFGSGLGPLPSRPGSISIFSSGGGISKLTDNIRQGDSKSSSGAASFAVFSEPSQEALALKPQAANSFSAKNVGPSDSRLEQSIRSARWIGSRSPSKKIIYWSECFHNACPGTPYIIDIQSTCDFTIYLTDEDGNIISVIGSGQGWVSYTFSFYTKCDDYRVKIVLNCPCGCGHACFNVWQDQTDCFKCKDPLLYTYNPETCECDCASTCQDCQKPQIWYKYPTCTCGCPNKRECPEGQYWDAKKCACKCLPNCCTCDLWPNTYGDCS